MSDEKLNAAEMQNNLKIELAQIIKRLLLSKKMSQKMLSDISGVAKSDISQIVNLKVKKSSVEKLIYLSNIIDSRYCVSIDVKLRQRGK